MKSLDDSAKRLLTAGDAAVSWWREHKPRGWSIAQHLKNPAVNCTTEREKRLARAAARWYEIQRCPPPTSSPEPTK